MENAGQFATALQRLGGDEQLFQELATYFIEDADELLKAIRGGFAAGDAETVGRAAHSLRGLAANFEAVQVVSVATLMERMASRGDFQAIPSVLLDLEIEVRSLQGMLKGYASRSTATRGR